MLVCQMISNAGKCMYAGIGELNGILVESAENLYCDVVPEIKKCVVPRNSADTALITLSAVELLGYAMAPSTKMLETLGVLALAYACLTTARYSEALEEERNKSDTIDKLQNQEQ